MKKDTQEQNSLSQQQNVAVENLPFKVSIVITNYNQGKFAEQAINSVLAQTYKNKEIIIVDDCSTDNSIDLIVNHIKTLSLEDQSIITLLKSQKNKGTAATRNEGIKNAKGQFIAFLDIDDFYYPDKVAVSIGKMIEFPGIGVAYSDYNILTESTGLLKREFKAPYDFEKLIHYCMVSTNSVVKREVFEKLGLFDESIKGMEDYQMWLRIGTKYMITHIPFALFCYRSHGGNKTETFDMKKWQAEEKAMKENFLRSIGRIQ